MAGGGRASRAARLETILKPFGVISIEHIGSTAIPGLPAKPIIDLVAQVPSYDTLSMIVEALTPDSWNYVPPELDLRPYRRFFVQTGNDRRIAHLHLYLLGEPRYEEQLVFRDALLDNREWAMAYGQLKVELAERHCRDREAYTNGKADFIEKILHERKVKVTREMTTDLRFPIGKFGYEGPITTEQREQWMMDIEQLPKQLSEALAGLSDDQLDTPYRPDGWTVRQVAHHIGDSHLNSFARFKLALTEEQPTIKPYYEERWASLPDASEAPVELSTSFIAALHARWVYLLRSMTEGDFAKTFYHPSSQAVTPLDIVLGLYSWHGRHHVAHITSLRERMGW